MTFIPEDFPSCPLLMKALDEQIRGSFSGPTRLKSHHTHAVPELPYMTDLPVER
jgi:hypothetical protein